MQHKCILKGILGLTTYTKLFKQERVKNSGSNIDTSSYIYGAQVDHQRRYGSIDSAVGKSLKSFHFIRTKVLCRRSELLKAQGQAFLVWISERKSQGKWGAVRPNATLRNRVKCSIIFLLMDLTCPPKPSWRYNVSKLTNLIRWCKVILTQENLNAFVGFLTRSSKT